MHHISMIRVYSKEPVAHIENESSCSGRISLLMAATRSRFPNNKTFIGTKNRGKGHDDIKIDLVKEMVNCK